ncbi:hypothetical protein KUTeg_012315 [Tegillarca granosa]|uniref:GFO/IDH/MocA-like oxidoreductase domain-containing protein n=1 Tax=Tegillarca granosa TaxID=220873 RepID=A0ABQ9F2P9_TEGGR|nr:hypothetical protein KUTeg_012315 [Tegillarca granosa]
MCRWMSGSRPQTVYVQGNAFDPEIAKCNDLDHVLVTIKFENGVIANIDNGRADGYGYDNRLEVLCDRGMLSIDNRLTNLVTEHGDAVTSIPRIDQDFLTRYLDAYANEIDHFLDVMEGKCELQVTKEDTIQAMKLVEACNKSISTQGPMRCHDVFLVKVFETSLKSAFLIKSIIEKFFNNWNVYRQNASESLSSSDADG